MQMHAIRGYRNDHCSILYVGRMHAAASRWANLRKKDSRVAWSRKGVFLDIHLLGQTMQKAGALHRFLLFGFLLQAGTAFWAELFSYCPSTHLSDDPFAHLLHILLFFSFSFVLEQSLAPTARNLRQSDIGTLQAR